MRFTLFAAFVAVAAQRASAICIEGQQCVADSMSKYGLVKIDLTASPEEIQAAYCESYQKIYVNALDCFEGDCLSEEEQAGICSQFDSTFNAIVLASSVGKNCEKPECTIGGSGMSGGAVFGAVLGGVAGVGVVVLVILQQVAPDRLAQLNCTQNLKLGLNFRKQSKEGEDLESGKEKDKKQQGKSLSTEVDVAQGSSSFGSN